jgi:hypothetical protein
MLPTIGRFYFVFTISLFCSLYSIKLISLEYSSLAKIMLDKCSIVVFLQQRYVQ